jgi:2-polyprenyl-6-methoxyphenol hydroxylase-like FAD-dependent oxidoreductase
MSTSSYVPTGVENSQAEPAVTLNVAIAGGGIGGLPPSGHLSLTENFEVYEKYKSSGKPEDIGLALVLMPNAVRILSDYFDINMSETGMVVGRTNIHSHGHTLETLHRNDYGAISAKVGYDLYMGTRTLVHDALLRAAVRDAVSIVYGAEVTNCVCLTCHIQGRWTTRTLKSCDHWVCSLGIGLTG